MKIGILTFHSALNYGAVLQTYASVCFLRSLGYDVFVLDYENPSIFRAYNPFSLNRERLSAEGLKYILKWPLLCVRRSKRKRSFLSFRKQYLPLVPFSEASGMDVLLIGSDQVWNPKLTGGLDPVYYGEAVPGVRKIAWAASIGKETLSLEGAEQILRHFSAISVREQHLASLLPGSMLLPDPTLLLTADQWKNLAHPIEGAYILAYPVLYEEEVISAARALAREQNLELKVLASGVKLGSGWMQDASPQEFVSLFLHADYVVTSSFHGAVYTLLFNKPHTFVFHEDPRYESLLEADFSAAPARASAFLSHSLGLASAKK